VNDDRGPHIVIGLLTEHRLLGAVDMREFAMRNVRGWAAAVPETPEKAPKGCIKTEGVPQNRKEGSIPEEHR
jgi:hypothetical protein